MYILSAQLLKNIQKTKMNTVGGEYGMRCSNCNSEMKIDEDWGYMVKYRCDVCRRIETLWTACVTA